MACVDIEESSNQETAKRINEEYPERAKAYTCNVAKMADVEKLKEAIKNDFGRVDILINNAGIIACSSFIDQDEDFVNKVIGVNLTSHFYVRICMCKSLLTAKNDKLKHEYLQSSSFLSDSMIIIFANI